MSTLSSFVYTIYLFTASDFKTIVIPKTALGIFNALSGSTLSTNSHGASTADVLTRIPLVFLWAWINLFPFNINNQRQPEAVLEDRVNKAWRPMPSGRISPQAATQTMIIAYIIALIQSWYLNALLPSAAILALGISYNNLGGADCSCILRNLHNAGLYLGFAIGTTMVAYGGNALNEAAWSWFGVIGLTVFLTVHMQDIPDQEGDRARARQTVPLVVGDAPARWAIATAMIACSIALPTFWQVDVRGYFAPAVLGAVVVWRVLAKRLVEEDEVTWKLWNGWILSLYALPFIKSLG